MSKVEKAKAQLNIAKSYIANETKRTQTMKNSSFNGLNSNIKLQNFQKAYEVVTVISSSIDKENALLYLSESIKTISNNLPGIFESKVCPPNLVVDVAAFCYIAKLGYYEPITKFVNTFFVHQWSTTEVNNLADSTLVPRELNKIRRPDQYSLEELHYFAQLIEKEQHIDMTWFYEHYPINKDRPPETKVDVKIGGKSISSSTITPPLAKPNFVKQPQTSIFSNNKQTQNKTVEFPPPRPFTVQEFIDMENEVTETLKRWNDIDL